MGKQYRRAYALLDNSKLVEADIRCRYLAARCLANLKEWEHCLNIMGWDPIYTDVAHLQVALCTVPYTLHKSLRLAWQHHWYLPDCCCCSDALNEEMSGCLSG